MTLIGRSSSRRIRRLGCLLAVVALSLVAGGCSGREQGTGDADPARIAPANSIAYVVADLQPPGEQGAAAQQILSRLPGVPDPDELLLEEIGNSLEPVNPKRLLAELRAPGVLGRRAALTVTGALDGEPQAAIILATSDRERVAAALAALRQRLGSVPADIRAVPRVYNGVTYFRSPGQAVGLVGSFLVVGDEPAFKAVVDASQGSGLTAHPPYASTLASTQGAIVAGYLDPERLSTLLDTAVPGPRPDVVAARAAASQAGGGPVTFTVRARGPSQAVVEVVTRVSRSPDGPNPPTGLVPALPADSWLAVGVPQIGASLRRGRAGMTPAEAASLEMFRADLRRRTGLDLFADIAPNVQDGAYYWRGASEATLRIGAVFRTISPVAARRLLAKARPAIARSARRDGLQVQAVTVAGASGFRVTGRNVPAGVYAVSRGSTVVLAQGEANTRAALSPTRRLSSSPDFQAAEASVGREPLFYLAFAPLTRALATGGESEDREIARYLGILRVLAVSTDVAGGTETTRVVFTLT